MAPSGACEFTGGPRRKRVRVVLASTGWTYTVHVTRRDPQLLLPLAMLLPLVVAMALVGVRGELAAEVVALVLALTVVAGGVMAGRAGGVAAALVAAVSFDFFFTEPYASLKIANGADVATTFLLLAVGLVVGAAVHRRSRRESAFGSEPSALLRVLHIAADGCAEDVVLSIRAELLTLLQLQDCWFTTEPTSLTILDEAGRLRISDTVHQAGDVRLPAEGVAVPVMWGDQCFGNIVAIPLPDRVTSAGSRRVAVAMAQALGLALAAEPATT